MRSAPMHRGRVGISSIGRIGVLMRGPPDLGIVKLTPKLGVGVPRTPAAPTGNSCNTLSRSPRLSQMTNRSFSAGFKANLTERT